MAQEHPSDLSPTSPHCSSLGCSATSLGSALPQFAPPSLNYPILGHAVRAQPCSAAPISHPMPHGPAPSPPYRSSPSRMVPKSPTRFHGSSTGSSVSMAMRFFPSHHDAGEFPWQLPLVWDPPVPSAALPSEQTSTTSAFPARAGCGTQACCEHGGRSPNSQGDNINFSSFCHPLTPIPGGFLLLAAGAVAADAWQVLGSPSD